MQISHKMKNKFYLKYITEFNSLYWLIVMNYTFMYMGIKGFNQISNQYFMDRYGFSQIVAGEVVGNIYLSAWIILPIIGYVIDSYGKKITFLLISSLLLIASQALFFILPASQSAHHTTYYGLIPIWLHGLSYGMYNAAFISMIYFAVKPQALASAYGIWFAFQNSGLVITQLITTILLDENNKSEKYEWLNAFYLIWGVIAFAFALLLLIIDHLNYKKAKRKSTQMIEYTNSRSFQSI